MNYKIVTSGKIEEVSLSELSQSLKIQSEVYELSDKEVYLGMISHKTLVLFATEFAHYALQNYAKKIIPEAETCIHLTRKWLEDLESVSNEQLIAAADAAYAASDVAAYAASDIADAAAAAANAAYAAASAASATAYASHATCDVAYAAGADKDREFIRQGEFIIDFLKSGKNLFLV